MSADPWEEAVAKARKAIYDDGRGMIGRNRNYLQDRVARAILAERKEAADALASKDEEIAAWVKYRCDAETLIGLKDIRIAALTKALADILACEDDARDPLQNGIGLIDCIDNVGQFYPSQHLADCLKRARQALQGDADD